MSAFIRPFAVQRSEGVKLRTPTAGHVIVKAGTTQTNGSLTVLEFLVPPKDGPAVHSHLREDEVWYVVEGDFRFKVGDAMLRASERGHGVRATRPTARLPERRRRVGAAAGDHRAVRAGAVLRESADLARPVDPEEVAAIGHANWMEFSGPPLAVSDPQS